MPNPNLLDLAKLKDHDKVVGLLEEVADSAPEVFAIPARTVTGTSYKISGRHTNPGVGFRQANDGWTPGKSSYFSRIIECKIFGGVINADKAVALADEDGPEAFRSREALGVANQAVLELGQQTIYGTATDANGFPGLKELHAQLSAERVQLGLTAIEVDATGTSAGTGSSVYMIKTGPMGVQYVFGGGDAFRMGEWTEQQVTVNNKQLPCFVNDLTAWAGLQAASIHSVGRLFDLTADSGKTLSDSLLWQLWHKFPLGHKPDLILMSRRSSQQLQTSRTVVINANGNTRGGNNVENIPAPADNFNGIPIVVTDSITDAETLV
jgi:hypothetical protein